MFQSMIFKSIYSCYKVNVFYRIFKLFNFLLIDSREIILLLIHLLSNDSNSLKVSKLFVSKFQNKLSIGKKVSQLAVILLLTISCQLFSFFFLTFNGHKNKVFKPHNKQPLSNKSIAHKKRQQIV